MKIDAASFLNIPDIQKNNNTQNTNADFGSFLKNELDKVNDLQVKADETTQGLLTGQTTDIHQVMLTTQEAKLSLELAMEIRNKLVDAYQEISRMQI